MSHGVLERHLPDFYGECLFLASRGVNRLHKRRASLGTGGGTRSQELVHLYKDRVADQPRLLKASVSDAFGGRRSVNVWPALSLYVKKIPHRANSCLSFNLEGDLSQSEL